MKTKKFFQSYWLLLTTILIATFFRFYKLGSIPPGLYPDEAANGLDVIGILEQGKHAVIFGTNGPRESLFIYFQAFFVWLGNFFSLDALNYTALSLRIAPAIIGVLTVWGIYLLGKEMFNRNVGIIAAAAMAVTPWHVQFSRNGFRAILAPLALTFLFYFFIKAYRDGKIKDYVGTAVFLALGFYTYLSFRMVPLIFAALLAYIVVVDRKFIINNFKKLAILSGIFLVLMVPLFIHFYFVPADIAGRASTSIFNPEFNNGSALKTFGKNVFDTAMMFNFKGDGNFRHNFAGAPQLDPIVGILFVFGFLITVFKFIKFEHFILMLWLGVMSLPALLTAEGMPHALRMVGTIPPIILMAGIGADYLISKVKMKNLAVYSALIILIASGGYTFNRYFLRFPSVAEARDAYTEDMVEMANDINRASSDRKNIVIAGQFGTKTIDFITHSTNNKFTQFEVRDIESNLVLPEDNYKVYVSRSWYEDAARKLQNIGMEGELTPVKSTNDGRVIYYEYEQ